MAHKLPPTAQAVISKCELCDRGSDARWFCTDCGDEMCKQCKTTHLRMKVSKNHNVIKTASDEETPTESPATVCPSHHEEPVQMYCINCEVLVCHTCIAGQHKNHRFEKLVNVIDKHREEISRCISASKERISRLQTSLQAVQNNGKTFQAESSKTTDEINKERQKWKSQIDRVADGLIEQVKISEVQNLQMIQEQETKINIKISDEKKLLQTCEETLKSTNDASIIKRADDIKLKQNQLKLCPKQTYISPPRFTPGDSVSFDTAFGQLMMGQSEKISDPTDAGSDDGLSSTIDMTVTANIKPGINCLCVSTVNDKQAWCGSRYGIGKDIALINTDGEVLHKVQLDFTLYDIAVTSTGGLLLTEYGGNHIKKYTKDGKIVNIADTSPYKTRGICTTDDHIIVCLYKDESSKVIKMTSEGQIQKTLQYDAKKKGLFMNPFIVTVNINDDVCVVDNHETVVVVNNEGKLRFRYPDSATSSNYINDFWGIVCDKLGYILISDFDNHRIHQIDKDGHFIQYILTEQHGIQYPLGLSIDNKGKLWICIDDGDEVRVVKYTSK